ncbi:MAG: DHH family phosphoesterase [Deinococcales bacterium]
MLTTNQLKAWELRAFAPARAVASLCEALSIPPFSQYPLVRGFSLESLKDLTPELSLSDIPSWRGAERLALAIQAKKRILIHGDYDADGISGTALLLLGLRSLGADVEPFIPNRLTDGYGIHPDRVAEHALRAEVFITVDCGISNLEEIKGLQAAGLEVIISDHHQPGPIWPDCLVIHPKSSPRAKKGLPELTGAGVAYHLLWALHEHLGLEAPLDYIDLATLGTIADVAPSWVKIRPLSQRV